MFIGLKRNRNPTRDDVAHHKVYQLRVAQDLGLRIPQTLITSSPDEASRFIEAQGFDLEINPAGPMVVYRRSNATAYCRCVSAADG
jgi:hypothetical protein